LSHTVEAFGKELKQNPSHPCATKNSVIEMAERNAYTNSRNSILNSGAAKKDKKKTLL
jgi:hypothetical protein